MGLAKRGADGILAGIDAPSREGDLASVGAQMLAPHGQDHSRLRPFSDRDQHRCGHVGLGADLREVADQRRLERGNGQRFA